MTAARSRPQTTSELPPLPDIKIPDHRNLHASPREVEIMQMSADGVSSRLIGKRLHITEDTVKTHKHRLYVRWKINGNGSPIGLAVLLALRAGLIR